MPPAAKEAPVGVVVPVITKVVGVSLADEVALTELDLSSSSLRRGQMPKCEGEYEGGELKEASNKLGKLGSKFKALRTLQTVQYSRKSSHQCKALYYEEVRHLQNGTERIECSRVLLLS